MFEPLAPDERFAFRCHPGVACFTECCRQLDLALTPYDVLRLKRRLALPSDRFLERYVLIEEDAHTPFPRCYLTMVDDGRASCVFVSRQGCAVYADRPAACRSYPVGRGVSARGDGRLQERFVLVREAHCQGFSEATFQTPREYGQDQGLKDYYHFNDLLLQLLHHPRLRQGMRPDRQQRQLYILALYDLDTFRQQLATGACQPPGPLSSRDVQGLAGDDEALLDLGLRFLLEQFFPEGRE